jgi:hypothetical protein
MNRALALLCALALVILTCLAAMPARSQTPQCAGLPDALAALAMRYQESPHVQGLTSAGAMMIITASPGGGFSVLLVSPDGTACMVASGEGFDVIEPDEPGVDG